MALYKIVFMVQLMAAEGLLSFRLEHMPRFRFRAALAMVLGVGAAALIPVLQYNAWYASAMFFLLFGVSLLLLRLCYDEPWGNLLFCGIAGYTAQHLAYLCYTALNEVTGLDDVFGMIVVPYSSESFNLDQGALLQLVIYLDCYFLVYGIVFDLFDDKLRGNHQLYLGRTSMVCLSGLLIGADVIFNMVTNYYTTEFASLILERVYNILRCLLILAMLYNQLASRRMKAELDSVRHIVEQGRSRYELAKRSTDLINMKYHDLRHQSQLLRSQGEVARQQSQELEAVLQDYASIVHTGNEVLDVILTEKTLLCQTKQIQLTAMAQGEGLGFVKAHHLYALLGNAIDNAIEAVEQLPQEQRIISLFVRSAGQLVHIHVENPCAGPVNMRGGLPLTSKADRDLHGFGMLSMRTIAEQYGGTLNVQVEDDVFSLDVMLCAPQEEPA